MDWDMSNSRAEMNTSEVGCVLALYLGILNAIDLKHTSLMCCIVRWKLTFVDEFYFTFIVVKDFKNYANIYVNIFSDKYPKCLIKYFFLPW